MGADAGTQAADLGSQLVAALAAEVVVEGHAHAQPGRTMDKAVGAAPVAWSTPHRGGRLSNACMSCPIGLSWPRAGFGAMGFRLAVAMPLLTAFLAGCAGKGDAGLLTANDAIAAALADAAPGAVLVGVYGQEGPGLVPQQSPTRLAFLDDGRADGVLGDGRLSSWVVGYVQKERFVEREVFADGLGELKEHDYPEFMLDGSVFRQTVHPIDSPEVARRNASDPCLLVDGDFAYRYAFSLYDEATVTGHGFFENYEDPGFLRFPDLGLPRLPNQWVVAQIDMSPGSRHDAQVLRLTEAGQPTGCDSGRPVERLQRYVMDSWEPDYAMVPLPYADSFKVGPRVELVRAKIGCQAYSPMNANEPEITLLMGDGGIAYQGSTWRYSFVEVASPTPGEWVLDIQPGNELPVSLERSGQDCHLDVDVHAYESLGP